MAIKIRLPYSTTSSVIPTAGNLLTGEMAINTADQKIYVKDTSSVKQLIGSQGLQGSQGVGGITGPVGAIGSQGSTGPQGGTGTQGVVGAPGFQGNPGPTGTTGPTGAQGTQGPQGAQGTRGPQGAQAAAGPQGLRGPQGPQGFTGPTGAPGTYIAVGVGVGVSCTTCFLGSSYTTMADGSRKMIKDVKIGDWLMGAFGEANQVLAAEDLTLGDRPMFIINYTHHTTGDHTHITSDKRFVSIEPEETINNDWNKWYTCKLSDGSFVKLFNKGLDNPKDRIKSLEINTILQTINGPQKVERIDEYTLPPETKLYNFVMSGSHTYAVDGYFVTGWPRDDDFDYTEWKQKGETSPVEAWMEKNGD